jgi:hypothetical protein
MAIKRLFWVLGLVLSFSLLFSCGGKGENPDLKTGDENFGDRDLAGGQTENGKSEPNIYEQFPKTDFEGRDFTILLFDYMQEEHYSESEIGDVFNDAVYNRNKKIEEDFNINLKFRANIYAEVTNDLKKACWSATTPTIWARCTRSRGRAWWETICIPTGIRRM